MKMPITSRFMKLFFCAIFFSIGSVCSGQYYMNLATTLSPKRSISQKIGYTSVEVIYSSPSVKGRKIWGELEPYGEIWRAGANYATTIQFSEDVLIQGQRINKGTYSFFIIPNEKDDWMVILNETAKQWGAFKYDESKDVFRKKMTIEKSEFQENLIYDIQSTNSRSAEIVMQWENIKLRIPFKTDLVTSLNTLLEQNLKEAKNFNKWIAYIQCAEILLHENESIQTAFEWINLAEQNADLEMEWNKQFYPKEYVLGHLLWTKAKILFELNNTDEAIKYADQMKNLETRSFYKKENDFEQIDVRMSKWKTK